jgi:hypothetical protein
MKNAHMPIAIHPCALFIYTELFTTLAIVSLVMISKSKTTPGTV